jgi:AraC-like DNA-binding protein
MDKTNKIKSMNLELIPLNDHFSIFLSKKSRFELDPFEENLLAIRVKEVLDLCNNCQKTKKEQSFSKRIEDSPDQRFLEKFLNVVHENYHNPEFDISDLTQKLGVSRSLLHKKLYALVGQSSSRIIRRFRLDKGKEMLEKANGHNISEIAYSVGFNDPKYFSRCFTHQFGTNPSNWMKLATIPSEKKSFTVCL